MSRYSDAARVYAGNTADEYRAMGTETNARHLAEAFDAGAASNAALLAECREAMFAMRDGVPFARAVSESLLARLDAASK